MSALFPTETNEERPRPRRAAWAITARPSAPLWERNPTRPGGGETEANVPSSETSGSVFTIPMQLGPMRRIPARRQISSSRRSRSRPSPPVSPNPAEITTSPRTPLRAHSSATSSTAAAGTTTNATSTGPGTSRTLG